MTDIAASNRQKLLNLSRATGRGFQELVQYFAMSRFLHRLSKTPAADRFVLKGALLLHALKITDARSTLDIDLLGKMSNTPEAIRSVMVAAIEQPVEPDGLEFQQDSIHISDITSDADYEGRRVRFAGTLGVIKIPMQIDIGFGDALVPPPTRINIPVLLGYEPGKLLGYAPETSIAEKTHTLLRLGMLNSRMKDLFDIHLMSRSIQLDEEDLVEAFAATFTRRGTVISMESVVFTDRYFDDENKQVQWAAFLRKRQIEGAPPRFSDVAREVTDFIKPLLDQAGRRQKSA
ncbi:MAG: nucleotidyl transferase AbiEii/AbiGii toxin family protein [Lentisphaeria bacterium]